MRPVIVGVDIGTTSAFAVLDLKGNLIKVKSERDFEPSKMSEEILKNGYPLILTTDKASAPESVKKLGSAFGSILHLPVSDISVEEKNQIQKKLELSLDSHERDALAAAVFACRNFSQQFAKIDSSLHSLGMEHHSERVKELILKKHAKNISEAVEKILGKKTKGKEVIEKRPRDIYRKINILRRKTEIQKIYIERLENDNKKTREELEKIKACQFRKMKETMKGVVKDRELNIRDSLIMQMQEQLRKKEDEIKGLNRRIEIFRERQEIEKTAVPVIILDDFSKEAIAKAENIFSIEGSTVYARSVKNPSAARLLASLRPKALIAKEIENECARILAENEIPFFLAEVTLCKNYGKINKKDFDDKLKDKAKAKKSLSFAVSACFQSAEQMHTNEENDADKEKKNFINWLDKYKKRQ